MFKFNVVLIVLIDDEQNTNSNECTINNVPPAGSSGSSIKVTLKKTRSCSSTSSRESTQSFEVRNIILLFW